MRIKHVALLAAIAPLFAAACDRPGDVPTAPDAAPRQAASPAPPAQSPKGLEGRFAELERQVPGFGGYFYGADGALNAYVTDLRNEGQARAALASVRREQAGSSEIRIQRGRYSFSELQRWHGKLSGAAAVQGVVYTDLDEAANRLTIAVESRGVESAVRQAAARAGIPAEAVRVVETEPIERLATLQDFVRPIQGGLQINHGNFLCTLGYLVWSGATSAYLTNSHCTNVQGGVEGTVHHQNLANNPIGVEFADPFYFVGGACPAGRACRYSDAALGSFNTGVAQGVGIHSTTGWGSITIAGTFGVVAEQPFPTVGQQIHKVGRTTGWTWGNVTATCVNVNVSGSTATLLCQDVVAAPSGGGDSGSPAFLLNGSAATVAGILWGGNGSSFVISATANIEAELGNLIFR